MRDPGYIAPLIQVPAFLGVRDGWLRWSFSTHLGFPPPDQEFDVSPQNIFDAFTAIPSGDAPAVIKFFSKYGPLSLCAKHGLPATHSRGCSPQQPEEDVYEEPIDGWYPLIRQAVFAVRLAINLRGISKRDPNKDDWTLLLDGIPPARRSRPGKASPEDVFVVRRPDSESGGLNLGLGVSHKLAYRLRARPLVASIVNNWLEWADLKPRFSWDESIAYRLEGPEESGQTFAALAVELMVHVARAQELASCSICFRLYERTKCGEDGKLHKVRLQRGRRNYCSPACEREGARRRAEESRANRGRKS